MNPRIDLSSNYSNKKNCQRATIFVHFETLSATKNAPIINSNPFACICKKTYFNFLYTKKNVVILVTLAKTEEIKKIVCSVPGSKTATAATRMYIFALFIKNHLMIMFI